MPQAFDALLIVSFGGPEKMDDVIPFLENVLRGRNVPRERMREVAEHYRHFGGVSPLNAQVRELIAALREELDRCGIRLPIYWGNRNWHPLLPDTLRQMRQDGVRRAWAYVTSAYSSWSGCRQYLDNIEAARAAVGPEAPVVEKLRAFYNHPEFIAANADRLRAAYEKLSPRHRDTAPIVYTAHSIPQTMADHCDYVLQLTETCRLVSEALELPPRRWQLVYQSRSGRPSDPWLGPDIADTLQSLRQRGAEEAVVSPLGFLSDHMEVLYDLDHEAAAACREIGLRMIRAATVGTHPRMVAMIRELVQERLDPATERRAIGQYGPRSDVCAPDCCFYTMRP